MESGHDYEGQALDLHVLAITLLSLVAVGTSQILTRSVAEKVGHQASIAVGACQ